MTVVEFYDRTPIENVISSLTIHPDKIIFIGDGKVMKRFENVYRSFLDKRGLERIELGSRNIKKNDINDIVRVLSEIVETEERCVFDLTGGDELVLVAMGIVFQKYADKNIQMQRFNVKNGVVTDCDNDGRVIYTGSPQVTVKENIRLHGGLVRYEEDGTRTLDWDLSDDFVGDVNKMWEICRANPGLWNSRLNVLGAADYYTKEESPLEASVNVEYLQDRLRKEGVKYVSIQGFLKLLARNRLIYSYADDGKNVSFTYKNKQVKRCLTKAGTVLELKVLVTAKGITDKDGAAYYTDAMSGVYIDWDGDFHKLGDEEKDTENEIDVVLMKGLVPIFISCKNGHVDDDELYKLDAVANRFGGPYAKKVLIATYLGRGPQSAKYFKQRAEDMKINLVDGVHALEDVRFEKMLKHLINS